MKTLRDYYWATSPYKLASEEVTDEEVAFARLAGVVPCPGWVHAERDKQTGSWESSPAGQASCVLCNARGGTVGYVSTAHLSPSTIKVLIWGARHNVELLKSKV